MKKQALVKLARARLAINYVLRNRMTKQAGMQVVARQPTTPTPKPIGLPNIMDPVSGFKKIKQTAGNLWDKHVTPWKDPNYVKPEFQYLQSIGSMFEEQPGYTNNIIPSTYTEGAVVKWYTARPYQDTTSANPDRAPHPMWDYDTPYKWNELAHRASLPRWHKDYASPSEVNRRTSEFYNAYNGNNSESGDYQMPYVSYREVPGMEDDDSPLGRLGMFALPKRYINMHNLPMYPAERVQYGNNKANWWNSWLEKINNGTTDFLDPNRMDYDRDIDPYNVSVDVDGNKIL